MILVIFNFYKPLLGFFFGLKAHKNGAKNVSF